MDNIIEVGVWSLQPVTPLGLMRNSYEIGEAMKDMWGGWRG